jgi:DNA-binding response OmpR family regulator
VKGIGADGWRPGPRETMPRVHRNDTQTAFPLAGERAQPSGEVFRCGAVAMAGRDVLLIDADVDARAVLADRLRVYGGYAVDEAAEGGAARLLARNKRFDAMILAMDAPGADGLALCRERRRAGSTAPIMLLGSGDVERETLLAFEAGANDYVAKPVKPHVLLARLRARLRDYERNSACSLPVGRFLLYPRERMLVEPPTMARVPLTDKETAVLTFLYRAGACAVDRRALLAHVWGYAAGVDTHAVEQLIYRLRRKLEPDRRRATILVTGGDGYRLVASARDVAA